MKHTLYTKVGHLVEHHLVDGVIPPANLQQVLKDIHTEVVTEALELYTDNRVLGEPAPDVDENEKFLPRQTRVVLAQLRSNFCSRLEDYQHRIGKINSDFCTNCNAAASSVHHIFDCQAFPTNLSPVDLWNRPWEVPHHLVTLPAFSDLPDVGPPPPRSRQRRRPSPEPPPPPSEPPPPPSPS